MKMTFQMGPIFVRIVFLENNMRNFMAYYKKKNSSSTIVKGKKLLFWSLLFFSSSTSQNKKQLSMIYLMKLKKASG